MSRSDAIRHLTMFALRAELTNEERLTLYDSIAAVGDAQELGELIGVASRLSRAARGLEADHETLRKLASQ